MKIRNNKKERNYGLYRVSETAHKKKTGVRAEMSRSNLIYNIISLMNEGAICLEDLEEFSKQLRETVRFIVER